MTKIVEAAAADTIVWQGPVATGFGGGGSSVSSGAGQWHDSGLFMIHGDDESVGVFMLALRDELQRTVELSGAKVTEPDVSAGESGNAPWQLAYTHGKHHGTILANIEPAPEDAHELVPGGQVPTHQLAIEIAEIFQSGSQ